jgi:hypothetical protein
MVQILPKVESFGSSFGKAIGGGLGEGVSKGLEKHKLSKQLEKENAEIKAKYGIDMSPFTDEKSRPKIFTQLLKNQAEENKNKSFNDLINGSTEEQNNQGFDPEETLERSEGIGELSDEGITPDEVPKSKGMKKSGVDPLKFSDEMILKAENIDLAKGKALRELREDAREEVRHREKLDQKNTEATRKEQLDFHKESEKYDEDILKGYKTSKKQMSAIKDTLKAVRSGNVKPGSITNIFKGFGKIGDKISNAVMNADEAAILANMPYLLEGWKDVFGVRLSDSDLALLEDKMPSMGKSKEANESVLKIFEKYADAANLRYKIGADIKKNNKGLRPLGYADKIEERYEAMTEEVEVINPNTGQKVKIPAYEVGDAIKYGGAKLANG